MKLNEINIYNNTDSMFLDLNENIKEHDHTFIFDVKEKIQYENKIIEGINKKTNNNLEIIRSVKDHMTIIYIIEKMSRYMRKNMEQNIDAFRCFAIINGIDIEKTNIFTKVPQVTILISQ